ncbi:MAG: exodeoxyribonuclease VII large subunit [Patescibacteria group bacterium]
MDHTLFRKLLAWRNQTAKKEGVEAYRVFSNETMRMILEVGPKSKEELIGIKGIKEKKFEKYGASILSLVNGNLDFDEKEANIKNETDQSILYSVGTYLTLINKSLEKQNARIQGEISSLDIRGTYLFFSLKDKIDKSILSCFMWQNSYQMSGVNLLEGMEIVVSGFPEVHKPTGKFTFRTETVELVGEGALKKAYDELKKKLESEGLFKIERKRALPNFPQRIGIITSKEGAAIGDFLANIGKFGFKISLIDSRVEGQLAIKQLLGSLRTFRKKKDIDVLVIMRGGGSMESLLPFNNETLIREIVDFPVPVLAGIGHEKDVPLFALVSDRMVSTPTAAAKALNESWEKIVFKIEMLQKKIFSIFESGLLSNKDAVTRALEIMKESFNAIFQRFDRAQSALKQAFVSMRLRFTEINKNLSSFLSTGVRLFEESTKKIILRLETSQKLLQTHDPDRQLNLGYSIVKAGNRIVRNVSQIKKDDLVNIKVLDGSFDSKVTNID